ncbi:excisionase family DNA binding protein [Propionicimonas paludicola]|uniref:Excisionase family DNA binding protein n=1 Tax=Propionicimonas paludicola TaxID=185243 RepID=A0A2A9CQA4_9ACTN|nr:helix-turn-helix domain-containing protein [Propionicimonas paludicola]PFG16265.1 excisionase family DNA binding protein [Propionicimonas paludicola]
MKSYNLALELDAGKEAAEGALGDRLLDQFADYHPVVTVSNLGRTELIVSIPAEHMWQATSTARALSADLGVTRVTVELSDDFDRRAGTEIPPLLSVTEVADRLGITRAAVQQRIDKGALPARRVGAAWVVPAAAVA